MAAQAWQFSSNSLWPHLIALWTRVLRISRRPPKALRLCESLPLGERRFVAVVEFERERFLVGGTPSSLVLLSRLADSGRTEDETQDEEEHSTEDGSGPAPPPEFAGQKPGRNQGSEKC
jgi:flagellar biogenesis protein FliO